MAVLKSKKTKFTFNICLQYPFIRIHKQNRSRNTRNANIEFNRQNRPFFFSFEFKKTGSEFPRNSLNYDITVKQTSHYSKLHAVHRIRQVNNGNSNIVN